MTKDDGFRCAQPILANDPRLAKLTTTDQAREVAQEYADDQRAIIKKLRKNMNQAVLPCFDLQWPRLTMAAA